MNSLLPAHRRADLKDGINPEIVLAVFCVNCGEYVGKWRELARREGFHEDTVECELCLGGEDE